MSVQRGKLKTGEGEIAYATQCLVSISTALQCGLKESPCFMSFAAHQDTEEPGKFNVLYTDDPQPRPRRIVMRHPEGSMKTNLALSLLNRGPMPCMISALDNQAQ